MTAEQNATERLAEIRKALRCEVGPTGEGGPRNGGDWQPMIAASEVWALLDALDSADAEVDRLLAEVDRLSDQLTAPEKQAEIAALKSAADDWLHGEWADTPRHTDRVADRIGAAQHFGDWLHARANRLETSWEETL